MQYNNRYDNNHQICTVGEYINKKENGGSLQDVRDISDLTHMVMEAKLKMNEVRSTQKIVENSAIDQYNKARSDVNEAFHFYTNLLEERKAELMRDLDTLYNNKRMVIKTYHQKHQQESLEKIYQVSQPSSHLSFTVCKLLATAAHKITLRSPKELMFHSLDAQPIRAHTKKESTEKKSVTNKDFFLLPSDVERFVLWGSAIFTLSFTWVRVP